MVRAAMNELAKRLYDLVFATLGLIVLSPLLTGLAVAVKLNDGGPVIFRQKRVGRHGRLFEMLKFRSMVVGAHCVGPELTAAGDARVTRVGRGLRRLKLDELPQLWNVLRGEMSLVGPRPEVPRYVAQYSEEQRRVLAVRPGITDPAALEFRDEERLLEGAADVEAFYISHCLPAKIKLNLVYAERANLWEDTKVITRTLLLLMAHTPRRPGDR